MNKHTDPVTIARELLTIDTSAIGGNIIVDGVDVLETTRKAQKVARAVIAAANLADRLDHEAESRRVARQDPLEVMTIRQEAARIRTALEGETRD